MLQDRLFCLPHIVERQVARFDQVRHDALRSSAKKHQQVTDEAPLRTVARDTSGKNMKVPNPSDPLKRLFPFKAIDRSLDGRVGRPGILSKCLLHLADGTFATSPERFHNLQFKL